jgi:hypothetical protein
MTLTTIYDLSKIVAFGGDDPDALGTSDPEEKEDEPGLEESGLEGEDTEEDPEKKPGEGDDEFEKDDLDEDDSEE